MISEVSVLDNIKKVRVVFNDDGTDTYEYDGEKVEFGDLAENVEVIRKALTEYGIEVVESPLREDNLPEFIKEVSENKDEAELIFNLCEGAFGYSAYEMNVAAILELFNLKFTGSGALTLGIALNKGWTKDVLKGAGVPTADYVLLNDYPESWELGLAFPLMVKPACEDASLGIEVSSIVHNEAELEARVDYVFREFEQSVLVERYIEGREFNISVFGNYDDVTTFPPSEIDFSGIPEGEPKICCYEAKWVEESPKYKKTMPMCPADVDEELQEKLEDVAMRAYDVMGCKDYARVDMRVDGDNNVYVLEVNPNPDISTDAGLARGAKAYELSYNELIVEIVTSAAGRYFDDPSAEEEDEDEDVEDMDEKVEAGDEEGEDEDVVAEA
ncbi:MAG: ATP-grasp domain-containing protein [Deltaproteobacteria bacterium]|nr:ATP-grasp domain-containing protein [Deltaproteobacteria bacterium]